jgi:hypothetical protein
MTVFFCDPGEDCLGGGTSGKGNGKKLRRFFTGYAGCYSRKEIVGQLIDSGKYPDLWIHGQSSQ